MKNIALAILAVGLCFYLAYNRHVNNDKDAFASFFAFIAAIGVFLV